MSHEKYFDQANLIPTPLPYELERQGDELLLVHWFQRDEKAMLKREIAVLCNWNEKGQDEVDGKFLLQSLSELETLEAQLADTRQREQLAVKMNLDLQQQVRELRKLLERHDTCSLRNSSTYARSSLAEATAAALRSAPPSGPLTFSDAYAGFLEHEVRRLKKCLPRLSSDEAKRGTAETIALIEAELTRRSAATKQAPYDKTDAWEERKDLARQGSDVDVATTTKRIRAREKSSSGVERPDTSASEQVPAATTTHSSTVVREAIADKPGNATQSGPQDSPSRSEWISVEERLPEQDIRYRHGGKEWSGSGEVLAWAWRGYDHWGPELAVYEGGRWQYADRHAGTLEVTHWQPLPSAPPSPAREKEKAE